jgi:hypothetical protein
MSCELKILLCMCSTERNRTDKMSEARCCKMQETRRMDSFLFLDDARFVFQYINHKYISLLLLRSLFILPFPITF